MTGPSLAYLWGRKAGSLASFDRCSDALKSSGIVWDDGALDGWLTDPQRMVPDNEMSFEGIEDDRVRADLLAFLKETTKPGAMPQQTAQQGGMKEWGGMGGMMAAARTPILKSLNLACQKGSPIAATVIELPRPTARPAPSGNAICDSGPIPARMGRTRARQQ